MVIVLLRKRVLWFFLSGVVILYLIGFFHQNEIRHSKQIWIPSLSDSEVYGLIDNILRMRNQVLLDGQTASLIKLYDRSTRNGIWAYEHQIKKIKYLHEWCAKQGVKLIFVKSLIRLRKVQTLNAKIRATLMASTEYRYIYYNEPTKVNRMRIGTYHSLDLVFTDNDWRVSREWYTDPFADALEVGEAQTEANQLFITTQPPRDFDDLNQRRVQAVEYADKYCGAAADDELGFKYNRNYRNFNYSGGDCANFASQVLHEGAGFSKNRTWNYHKDASCAWVNAHVFNRYMLNSGRASKIACGSYEQVLRASYKLLPGDYIAYEKKGKVTHISVVTGADSKGYTVMNSHNADRYRVPWDLGYGDQGIRFWLVRVNY
ncbi:MAG TPA: amidase domain-containing protein [Bacillota bacterium]|nr:amidase domain-containing protein [Bacillota bacterium]